MRKVFSCGSCGAYHLADFEGDCREDSAMIVDLRPDDEVYEQCECCGRCVGVDCDCLGPA